ncbi:hypothetical protein MSAN_00022500 [Mycena sanguinolenta]|uniref:Uncharacterized protein n=1 Tax=Mycena sanguinolenta TaxID=230812 RepID=A0A8H7DJX0_9AGAR|nr:hypothetical protein MSAN_00022500 [Mycena sanguinolenta]
MSFPKGPRFAPEQISDVPGPNFYNLNQESRVPTAAFLEKADRFSKQSTSEVPGPGAYNTGVGKPESKSTSKPPVNGGERYAILQRKVEDLERIHSDGKKAHQAEVERLKLELNRAQKTNAENADRLEKQKKQNAMLETRIQDLKKSASTELGEIKDLRVKLRMSEHERAQLVGKQGETEDLRKAMHSLESRRRDEVRERDRTIADLEKSTGAEKKRREMVEAKLQELQRRGDADLEAVQARAQSLQVQLTVSQEEAQQVARSLAASEVDAEAKQASLLEQLEQHRRVLLSAAEAYGRLAAETVSATLHAKLQHEHRALQMRTWRLERKLANSEGQLTELVNLVRHAHDTNALLQREVQDLSEECSFYRRTLPERPEETPQLGPLSDALATAMHELHETQLSQCQSDNILATSFAELYRLSCDELSAAYSTVNAELEREQLALRHLRVELLQTVQEKETLAAEFTNAKQQRDGLSEKLATAGQMMDELKLSAAKAEEQSAEIGCKMAAKIRESELAANTNKTAIKKLTETVQKSRMAEEGLRAEIEILTTELAESDQFQAAYYSLSDEVKSLIARKELAEGEADRLSKFNAEILGHQNPAQRIMYVDRIRRELAETKHKLVATETECESVTSQNAELVRELQMYKSTSVPSENKPRTLVTRVSRPPLVALNLTTAPTVKESYERNEMEEFSFNSRPPLVALNSNTAVAVKASCERNDLNVIEDFSFAM